MKLAKRKTKPGLLRTHNRIKIYKRQQKLLQFDLGSLRVKSSAYKNVHKV